MSVEIADKTLEEMLEEMRQYNDPAQLPTFSMTDLYETVYPSRPPVIDGLLYPGTFLLAGSPKVGKSFLVAQIAYHVSMGIPLWGFSVQQGVVLYLALEDNQQRLQKRLYRMFGPDSTADLLFAIRAKQLGNGLETQLNRFLQDHPDTKLVIIDTLQKTMEGQNEKYSYQRDYDTVCKFKQISDTNGFTLLLVHHTRKLKADDSFDMISGTNGLFGAADGAFILKRERRTDGAAFLDVAGRDQPDQRLHLIRDKERLVWDLREVEADIDVEPPDPVLDAVATLVDADRPEWAGTASELVSLTGLDIKPNTLTLRLNVNAGRLMNDYHISYENARSHTGRQVKLAYIPRCA